MKTFAFLYFTMLLMLLSCGNRQSTMDEKKADTLDHADLSLLQGAWWSEENQNSALFLIADDSLYFTDEQESPYFLQVSGNKMILKSDSLIRVLEVKKLTKDSLKFYDSAINETFTLSKPISRTN